MTDAQTALTPQRDTTTELLRTEKIRFLEQQVSILESDLRHVNSLLAKVTAERDQLLEEHPPEPQKPWFAIDDELVMSLRTHGIPAYKAMVDIIGHAMKPLETSDGIVKWLKRMFDTSWGREIADGLAEMERRIEAADNGSAFYPVWHSYQWNYGRSLWWYAILVKECGVDVSVVPNLERWVGLHDQYMARIILLSNSVTRAEMKRTLQSIEPTNESRDKIMKAVSLASSQAPDTEGPQS